MIAFRSLIAFLGGKKKSKKSWHTYCFVSLKKQKIQQKGNKKMKKDDELDITPEKAAKLIDSNIERLRQKYRGKMKNKNHLLMGEFVSIFHEHVWSPMIVHNGYLEIELGLNLFIDGAILLFFDKELVWEWYLSGNKKFIKKETKK